MKKVLIQLVLVVSIAILFSSCAAHFGIMTGSASLSSANFSYVKQDVKGMSKAIYVFGIGGILKESLINNAKQQMLASNPLKNNQALANVTVSYKKTSVLGIYTTMKCIVTADIVEFK